VVVEVVLEVLPVLLAVLEAVAQDQMEAHMV